MSNETLAVISNGDLISVNQDPDGVAGRRVASMPPIGEWTPEYPDDMMAMLARCEPGSPTQQWSYTEQQPRPDTKPDMLFVALCNASDVKQQWDLTGGQLKSITNGKCVDRALQSDPLKTGPCSSGKASQAWGWNASTNEVTGQGWCLDVYSGGRVGPDVCSFL